MTEHTVEKTIEVNVEFGGVSFGDQTARVGIAFDPEEFTSKNAEAFLVGSRLAIIALPGSQDATSFRQKELMDSGKRLEADVDCKGYQRGPHAFKAGLTFNVSSVDESKLVHLRKKKGRIAMTWIGPCGGIDDDDEDDEQDPDDRLFEEGKNKPAGSPLVGAAKAIAGRIGGTDDPGKDYSLDTLGKSDLKKLAKKHGKEYEDQGLTELRIGALKEGLEVYTVSQLEKRMDTDPLWWHKVKRLGVSGCDAVSDARILFRQCVGYPSDSDAPEGEEAGIDLDKALKTDTPKEEAYTMGANDALAGFDPANNFPAGTEAHAAYQKGFEDTVSQSDADAGTMFADEHTEDVDDESEEETEQE